MEGYNLLYDGGLSAVEAVEQLTYLLVLKLEDEERQTAVSGEQPEAPTPHGWSSLTKKRSGPLVAQYTQILAQRSSSTSGTAVDAVFAGAQNHISDPALLQRLILDLFDVERWNGYGESLLGEAYGELLQRTMNERRSGAGQFFTPRPLIEAIVEVLQPALTDTINDPACGMGGFLLGAHDYLARQLASSTSDEECQYGSQQRRGAELVPGAARLATANLLLHGAVTAGQPAPISVRDALAQQPDRKASLVLTHPPFGKHAELFGEGSRHTYERPDFMTVSTDKQINFLQHVMSLIAVRGRAAVVVSDNVLFAQGAAETIRRDLLNRFDVHTILRLPTGTFPSASGVRASVIFFDQHANHAGEFPQTSGIWVYDLRPRRPFDASSSPLNQRVLNEFVSAYGPGLYRTDRRETEHFRYFDIHDVLEHDHASLDLTPQNEDSEEGPLATPEEIAQGVLNDLHIALQEFKELTAELRHDDAE
ncbi:type I restriction-modification system subunit M [Streptomyces sp. NBC_00569]|uniref:HsdM family class I SAM-dependent methyltransferase n=1 Tax=Streptomyces sp. NBC_00569 TaxID=2975780 RepID=UPI002E823AB2|nr:class I SAM-dependent DNA methyltransferase [Streptomyces sp. NBC_00569]WUB92485.1 type I restriction-modification system subunit M [Streptomyces sp. NBC_00569]